MVLAFPGQYLSDKEHLAFSQRLGSLELTDTRKFADEGPKPPFIKFANVDGKGQTVADPEARLNRYLRGNQFWHTDSSFKRIGAKASGDLVLWDNRCMLHKGHPWDFAEPRVMKRTTVAGEPASGDQNEWALVEPAAVS